MRLGNFRKQRNGETDAAYFRAACFKAAKVAGKDVGNEKSINRFICIVIGRAHNFRDFEFAYNYMKNQLNGDGELHICANDLLDIAAWFQYGRPTQRVGLFFYKKNPKTSLVYFSYIKYWFLRKKLYDRKSIFYKNNLWLWQM